MGQDTDNLYTLYRRGVELLADGSFREATVPLAEVARNEPEKTSVREALGRAYFRSGRYAKARDEFAAVVERYPTNDFALFCLGRACELTGDKREARKHLTLAANLRPDRADYRAYRDRIRRKAA